jgi:DNA-binding beta-propeller fold protein YncE
MRKLSIMFSLCLALLMPGFAHHTAKAQAVRAANATPVTLAKTVYFIGNDPAKWQTGVPAASAWAGITLLAFAIFAFFAAIRRRGASCLRMAGALVVPFVVACGSIASAQTAHFSGVQSTVASGGMTPAAVAVDANGNVYIADTGNDRVLKETPTGGGYTQSVVADFASSGLRNPTSIAVDGMGNVYIADPYSNRVLKETLSGGSYANSIVPTTTFIYVGGFNNEAQRVG